MRMLLEKPFGREAMQWIVLVLVSTLVGYVYYRRRRRRMELLAAKIPGDPGLPFIGDIWRFLKTGDVREVSAVWRKDEQRYKGIQRYWFGNFLVIRISDPDYVTKVLSNAKVTEKSLYFYHTFKKAFNGPLTENGKDAVQLRKGINKYMSKSCLESYHMILVEETNSYIKGVEENYLDIQLDVNESVFNLISGAVGESFSGVNSNKLLKRKHFFLIISEGVNLIVKRLIKPHTYFTDIIFNGSRDEKNLQKVIQEGLSFMGEVVDERNKMRAEDNEGKVGQVYLDLVLKIAHEERYSRKRLLKILMEFSLAGSWTTTTAVCSAMLFLAMFPELQEEALAEQERIFKGTEREPEPQDLVEMDFLNRFIQETLRVISWFLIARKITSDLDLGDYVLPAGANVAINFKSLQMDPAVWDEPRKFNPDNFLPEKITQRSKGSFVPFALGPRSCPGSQFAMNFMKIIISKTLRKFKLSTTLKYKELKFQPKLLQTVKEGYLIKHESRSRN